MGMGTGGSAHTTEVANAARLVDLIGVWCLAGVPNGLPLLYEFGADGEVVEGTQPGSCYVPPIKARYLGDACVQFNELDADGSGGLDAAELGMLVDVCRADFAALDLDGDGRLDPADLEAAAEACGDWLLAEADTNGDGIINFNEYMAWWARRQRRRSSER